MSAIDRLLVAQPWLKSRENALKALFDLCESESELDLVEDLVTRIQSVSTEQFYDLLVGMAGAITEEWGLNEGNCVIVASTADELADSAQVVIYELKCALAEAGWDSGIYVNQVGKAHKNLGKIRQIVIVDEFIGSGQSMRGRVAHIRENCGNIGIADVDIRVCVAVGIENAIDDLREDVDVYCGLPLKKGISGHYENEALELATKNMTRLESALLSEFNGKKLPSFGYNQAEALFRRERAHSPNSVFPVFWWKYLSNNQKRLTILSRAMAEA